MKPVRIRPRADRDVDSAIERLLDENPPSAAKFLQELQAAVTRIAERPAIGSPRYARLLRGLRVWRLRRFPYMVFYLAHPSYIDIVRVLHDARDIPAILQTKRGRNER
jgi:toxin ParE1/3/4